MSTSTDKTSSTDKKTSSTTTSKPATFESFTDKAIKAQAVVTIDEICRMIDLGLGRGVDATRNSPWKNKSSFQVRKVTIDNIIGTEEGGSMQSYEREISSVQTQQSNLKASVTIPNSPVSLGLEGEETRSVSSTRKAVGKKVLNRTISFRSDFKDNPTSSTDDPNTAKLETLQKPTGLYVTPTTPAGKPAKSQSDFTFEERLSIMIVERIMHRQHLAAEQAATTGSKPPNQFRFEGVSPVIDLASYLRSANKDELKLLVKDCATFVRHFRITHYVNGIELGAALYRVFSETEYFTRLGSSGSLGVESIANIALSGSFSSKKTKKASDVRQIGKITNEAVERGSYDEAVVGVEIEPISRLVQLRYLHLALRKALIDYIDDQADESSGPFLLSCYDDKVFWRVNQENDFAVEATTEIHNASLFFIIPNDDGIHPYEFLVAYYGENRKGLRRVMSTLSPLTHKYVDPIPRYLSAPVDVLGHNSGPLHLKDEVGEKDSRLTLHSRLVGPKTPIDTRNWVTSRDQYFINCSRRRFRVDGYISVNRVRRGREYTYHTACKASLKEHNNRNVGMLFRLLPSSFREKPEIGRITSDNSGKQASFRNMEEIDKEYEEIFGRDPTEGEDVPITLSLSGKHRSDTDSKKLLASANLGTTKGLAIPKVGAAVEMHEPASFSERSAGVATRFSTTPI